MFAQEQKARFFARLLYLSIFIAIIAQANGEESWSASWSWPSENKKRYYLTDEDVIDLLYARATRAVPDHPTLPERLRYMKGINSHEDLTKRKEEIEKLVSPNRRGSYFSSFYHRVYH